MGTKIEWTDETWNPLVGCEHVSPGCDNCYAAREASGRLSGHPVYAGLAEAGRFSGEVRVLPERLEQPLRWRRPRRVFVNSMSDLFHRSVLAETIVDRNGVEWPFLAETFAVMVRAERHTFQVLTKRPQIAAAVLSEPRFRLDVNSILLRDGHPVMPGGMTDPSFRWPANIWIGTSIESDRYAWRANHLRATPAAVRFLSCEPLLGPLPSLDLAGLDWLIAGGESGPKARPMASAWVRDLRDRAVAAGVAFSFKQWGEWAPATPSWSPMRSDDRWTEVDGERVVRLGKKQSGRLLDGRTWDEYPA